MTEAPGDWPPPLQAIELDAAAGQTQMACWCYEAARGCRDSSVTRRYRDSVRAAARTITKRIAGLHKGEWAAASGLPMLALPLRCDAMNQKPGTDRSSW